MPTFVVSLFTNDGKVPLPVFLTKSRQPSAHAQCASARRALYRIMEIRGFLQNGIKIIEFDRVGEDYRQTVVIKSSDLLPSPCRCHATMLSFDDVTTELRRQYLLESLLGCKTTHSRIHATFHDAIDKLSKIDQRFCDRFELIWMSTVAWMSAGVSFALVLSLILVLAHGFLSEGDESYDLLVSAIGAGDSDSFDHVGELSQWQCWIQIAMALNCALDFPAQKATIGVFDCETVAAVYNQVSTWRRKKLEEEGI